MSDAGLGRQCFYFCLWRCVYFHAFQCSYEYEWWILPDRYRLAASSAFFLFSISVRPSVIYFLITEGLGFHQFTVFFTGSNAKPLPRGATAEWNALLVQRWYCQPRLDGENNKKGGKPGNLITLIKQPSLPQYYVNHFTPPHHENPVFFTPG